MGSQAFSAGVLTGWSYLAGKFTFPPAPSRCARARPIQGVAGSTVEALARQVTTKAPCATGTADGAVHSVPACHDKKARVHEETKAAGRLAKPFPATFPLEES